MRPMFFSVSALTKQKIKWGASSISRKKKTTLLFGVSSPPCSSPLFSFLLHPCSHRLPPLSTASESENRTSIPTTTLAPSNKMAVTMAKGEEELKEVRAKTTEEINEEIVDLKGELFMLRLQRSARNEFKSSEFPRMRKRVARMLSVRREIEIEEAVNKRLSRKLDRKWKKSIVVRPHSSLRKEEEKAKAAESQNSA